MEPLIDGRLLPRTHPLVRRSQAIMDSDSWGFAAGAEPPAELVDFARAVGWLRDERVTCDSFAKHDVSARGPGAHDDSCGGMEPHTDHGHTETPGDLTVLVYLEGACTGGGLHIFAEEPEAGADPRHAARYTIDPWASQADGLVQVVMLPFGTWHQPAAFTGERKIVVYRMWGGAPPAARKTATP